MVKNQEPEAEIRAAITPQVASVLHIALQSARQEREGAPPIELVGRLTAFTGLVGQNWTADGREEFIGLALYELRTLPAQMTLDALAEARRKVNDGRNLLTWVYDRIEGKLRRLDEEIKRLDFLNSLVASEA